MKTLKSRVIKLYNTSTGEYEYVDALRGESAYEIAKRNGYTGSEEKWLNAHIAEKDEFLDAIATAGSAQVVLVEKEGTEQVGLVEDEGIKQVGLVEDEGEAQVILVQQAGTQQATIVSDAVAAADAATKKANTATSNANAAAIDAQNAIAGLDDKVDAAVEERIATITDGLADGSEYAAEVVSARTDETGKTHVSLKTRINEGLTQLSDSKADGISDSSARATSHELHAQVAPLGVTVYGKTTETGEGDKSPDNPYTISGLETVSARAGGRNLVTRTDFPWSIDSVQNRTVVDVGADQTFSRVTLIFDFSGAVYTNPTGAIAAFVKSDDTRKYIMATTLGNSGEVISGKRVVTFENVSFKKIEVFFSASYAKWTSGTLNGLYIDTGDLFNVSEIGTILPDGSPLYGNGTVDDTVELNVPSGCDGYVELDGSEDEGWIFEADNLFKIRGISALFPNLYVAGLATSVYTNWIPYGKHPWTASNSIGIGVYDGSSLEVKCSEVSDLDDPLTEWRAKLAANPLKIWYRSKAYTPKNDIRVCRTVRKWINIQNIAPTQIEEVNWATKTDKTAVYVFNTTWINSPHKKPGTLNISCETLKTQDASGSTDVLSIWGNLSSDVSIYVRIPALEKTDALRWMADHPLTIVYELKTPEVYYSDAKEVALYPPYGVKPVTVLGSGDTSLEYMRDTKSYIDDQHDSLARAIEVVDNRVDDADRNIETLFNVKANKTDTQLLSDIKADGIVDSDDRKVSHELHAQMAPLNVTVYGKTTETGSGDKSPENPYVINGVDDVRVHAGTKNLINPVANFIMSQAMATYEITDDGFYAETKISADSPDVAIMFFAIKNTMPHGAKCKISFKFSATNSFDSGLRPNELFVYGVKKGQYFASGTLITYNKLGGDQTDAEKTLSFVANDLYDSFTIAFYVNVALSTSETATTVTFKNFQVEVGDTATTYEPYNANIKEIGTILPDGDPLYGNGEIDDTVEFNVASGCDKKIVLDGSEDEEFTLVTGTAYQIWIPAYAHSNVAMYTDHMPVMTWGVTTASQVESGKVAWHATADTIYINDPKCTSIAALRAKLAANPLTVFYRSTDYTPENDLRVCRTTRNYRSGKISEFSWTKEGANGHGLTSFYAKTKGTLYASGNVFCETIKSGFAEWNSATNKIYGNKSNNRLYIIIDPAQLSADSVAGLIAAVGESNLYYRVNPEVYYSDTLKLYPPYGVKPVTVLGSGETAVEYIHDAKHYIDQKIAAAVAAALAE